MSVNRNGDKWLGSFVPYLLYRTSNQLNLRIRGRLRKVGVNIARWRVLAVLRAHGKLKLGEIASLTGMQQPSVSRIVTQLEREELARRRTSTNDSRVVHVSLTSAGEKAFAAIYPAAKLHQEQALDGFTAAEVKKLVDYLQRIQGNIEAQD